MNRSTSKSADRHLASLSRSISGAVGEFACGGEVPLAAPLTFRFADGKSLALKPPPGEADAWIGQHRYEKQKTDLAKKLMKHCAPAPFGAGAETRVDRRVRDALQLRAADGAFTLEGFAPLLSSVLACVQSALAPRDPNPLVATFYGMNIYATGGHFVPHKDTPRGDAMLGTLVVCLPIAFSGGALWVSHRGVEKRFDWNPGYRRGPAPTHYRWAAFFGDVDHEIRRVRSGHRVTLTWVIERTEGAVPSAPLPGTTTERFSAALRDAVADPGFFPGGACLGVPCVHLYTRPNDGPLEAEDLDIRTALRLKGRDQDVVLGALHAGLRVQLVPLLTERSAEQNWPLKRALTPREASLFQRRRLADSTMEARLPLASGAVYGGELVDAWLPSAPTFRRSRAELAPADTVALTFLGEPDYSGTGYFGNESALSEFYAYAALVISVPARP